jgi:drug/metabolite transporter superfamily protein YnfA
MRKTFIILSIILILFGIIFTVLPMQKFGMIAAFCAAVFGVLAYHKSEITDSNFPKYLSMIAMGTFFCAAYFTFFTKAEVIEIDPQFEQEKIESQKQDQKDLQDLEGL